MTKVLDTANGIAVPAFYLVRPAGDVDAQGNAVDSFAGWLVGCSKTPRDHDVCQAVIEWQYAQNNAKNNASAGVAVLVINSTFSPIYLAEDATIVHGASSTQVAYPTCNGKTHMVPPTVPHPTIPGSYLVGFGAFAYGGNAWGNCCGAMKFSAKEDGSGPTPALAFWLHPSTRDLNAVSVAANLESYGGSAQKFFDSTVGASPQSLSSSDSAGNLAIAASVDAWSGGPSDNATVTVRIYTSIPDYTIVDGDTLSDIAEAFYEDRTVYPQILAANPGKIADPNVIPSGLKLTMPDLI